MSINIGPPVVDELKPKIAVIGVGGAGGNAIANMIGARVEGVDFVVANTDAQALTMSKAQRIVQMGPLPNIVTSLVPTSPKALVRVLARKLVVPRLKKLLSRSKVHCRVRICALSPLVWAAAPVPVRLQLLLVQPAK